MSYVCSECGKTHDGFPALAFKRPDYWLGLPAYKKFFGKSDDDRCRTPDGHYFVRAVLEIPVHNGPEPKLEYGLWASLSKKNFRRYAMTYGDADQSKLGPMFGWMSNEISDFPGSLNLKCYVQPRDEKLRPMLEIEPTDHPLSLAHHNGIAFELAQRIVHRGLNSGASD